MLCADQGKSYPLCASQIKKIAILLKIERDSGCAPTTLRAMTEQMTSKKPSIKVCRIASHALILPPGRNYKLRKSLKKNIVRHLDFS